MRLGAIEQVSTSEQWDDSRPLGGQGVGLRRGLGTGENEDFRWYRRFGIFLSLQLQSKNNHDRISLSPFSIDPSRMCSTRKECTRIICCGRREEGRACQGVLDVHPPTINLHNLPPQGRPKCPSPGTSTLSVFLLVPLSDPCAFEGKASSSRLTSGSPSIALLVLVPPPVNAHTAILHGRQGTSSSKDREELVWAEEMLGAGGDKYHDACRSLIPVASS